MYTLLLVIGTAIYSAVATYWFLSECFVNGIGFAFGQELTPIWITVIRAIFWPIFLVLDVAFSLYLDLKTK